MMSKLLLLLILFVTLGVSHQDTAPDRNKTDIVRSFRGMKVPSNRLNMHLASKPPMLKVEDNDTLHYFTGILSTRLIPVAYIVAMIIGIPSNALVLATLSTKTKTFSTAILYSSLVVSDLVVLLTLTFKVHYHLNGNDWVFGEAMCKVVTACFYGNIYCSIHMLMCISIKRYLAIAHPFLYKSLPKRSYTIWVTLTVWAIFLVAMVPEFLIRQSYKIQQFDITTCHDVLPHMGKYSTFLLYYKLGLVCLGFFLPFVVTAISYMVIIYQLNKSHHDWIYYIIMSTLMFMIFTLCFAPSNIMNFLHHIKLYTTHEEYFYIYHNVALGLCSLHCCLDPFLFFLLSKTTGSKSHFKSIEGKYTSVSI